MATLNIRFPSTDTLVIVTTIEILLWFQYYKCQSTYSASIFLKLWMTKLWYKIIPNCTYDLPPWKSELNKDANGWRKLPISPRFTLLEFYLCSVRDRTELVSRSESSATENQLESHYTVIYLWYYVYNYIWLII